MNRVTVTLLLVVCIGGCLVVLATAAGPWRLPGDNQGYMPEQPIAFSHHLHAGQLGVDCLYCHYGAEVSRTAGVPPAEICLNCHRYVTAPLYALREEAIAADREQREPKRIVSAELKKLYDSLAVDEGALPSPSVTPDPSRAKPIAWVRVHDLPDFVHFDHRAHVRVGVACQECHGSVETMDRVWQASSLSMGWCVNCHRRAMAEGIYGKPARSLTDCAVCHF